MIIRMNGQIISGKKDLDQPKSVTGIGGESFKAKRADLIRSAMPLGHKAVFGMAIATMFIDVAFGGGIDGVVATASAETTVEGIANAFDPVKRFLIALADPLCYIMFVWGCIEAMVGRAASGLNRMKYAALGYIAMNWIPLLMDMIRQSAPGV